MTKPLEDADATRKQAYAHILRSVQSAFYVLIECCHEINDLRLDAARNTHDMNVILGWVESVRSQIHKKYPDLAPKREPLLRRWPADPRKSPAPRDLTRAQALFRLRHHLELAWLILHESGPFAGGLELAAHGLSEHLRKIEDVQRAVVQEIWKDLPNQRKRDWVRERGLPEGVPEPPPLDRHDALGRLNEKLGTASQVLDDCAELIVELELEPKDSLRAVGSCLATIFDIQQQIYEERPDLIPGFLKDSYELRGQEKRRREQDKE